MGIVKKLAILALMLMQMSNVYGSARGSFCGLPEDLVEPLSEYMVRQCPIIPCDQEGYYFRPATPLDMKHTKAEFDANMADPNDPKRFFFCLPDDSAPGLLVHLMGVIDGEMHPAQFKGQEGITPYYTFFRTEPDGSDTILGYFHLQVNKEDLTKAGFARYILKEHRGHGYSGIMHRGILQLLNGKKERGKNQYTLHPALDILSLLGNPEGIHLSTVATREFQSYTGVIQEIPLGNPESFIGAVRDGLRPIALKHLYTVQGAAYKLVYKGVSEAMAEAINTLLIFTDEPASETRTAFETEVSTALLAYVNTPRAMREAAFPDLERAVYKFLDEDTPVYCP